MLLPGHIIPYSTDSLYDGIGYFAENLGSSVLIRVKDSAGTTSVRFLLRGDKELLNSRTVIINDRIFMYVLYNVYTYDNYDFGTNLICTVMPYIFKFSLDMEFEAVSRPVGLDPTAYTITQDTSEIIAVSNDFLEKIEYKNDNFIIPYFNLNGVAHIKLYDFNLVEIRDIVLNQQYDLYDRPGVRVDNNGITVIAGTPYISEKSRDSSIISITYTIDDNTCGTVLNRKIGPTWVRIDEYSSYMSIPYNSAISTKTNYCTVSNQNNGLIQLFRTKRYSEKILLTDLGNAGGTGAVIEEGYGIHMYENTGNTITAIKYIDSFTKSQKFMHSIDNGSLFLWCIDRANTGYQYTAYVNEGYLIIGKYNITQLSLLPTMVSIELENQSAVLKSTLYENGLYHFLFTTDTGILINTYKIEDNTCTQETYAEISGEYDNAVIIGANDSILTLGCSKINEYLDIIKTKYYGFIQAEAQFSLVDTEITVAVHNNTRALVSVYRDSETGLYTQKLIVLNEALEAAEIVQYTDNQPYVNGIACTDDTIITSMSELTDNNTAKIYMIETTATGQITNLSYIPVTDTQTSYRSCDFCLIGEPTEIDNISYAGNGNGKFSNTCVTFW